ncbi:MAG: acyltransferase, partial [Actinobacteria bacterium]|nr:acyltransferase [Actinomycetota bacterium]
SGDHGVDVFFVLSGFLITTLLLNEHRLSGHISLSRFYVRRVLRLYPVVLLLLAVGAFVIIVDPSFPTAPHWSGLAATSFYYANWFHGVNPVAMGFLAPTWSLAIEEQFYLVWPPIVLLLIARSRGRSGLAFLAGAGAVAAALYRLAIWEPALGRPARGIAGVPLANLRFHAFNDWYFNSFSRADTILVGCVLALTLTPAVVAKLKDRPALVTRLMWLATLIAVYICLRETILGGRKEDAPGARYGNSDFVPIWGLAVFEVCVALVILGLVVLPGSRMASVLSNRALVWTGRRSYALYVLHTPIFDTFDHFRVVHGYYLPMVVKLIASFVAAALSYRLIEAPVLRLKDRYAGRLASRRDAPASLPADALSNQRV